MMPDQASVGESTEVSWQLPQLDSITIHGTLLAPSGPGPFSAVVMVAGSGPTDRNWTSPLLAGTNGSAHLIADALAKVGIASLRYDKQAADPQIREHLDALVGKISMQSHLNELTGAVRSLASKPTIRENRIFALTNSEGALHALNYQVHNPAIPFAGLVLTAPPGREVGAVARTQLTEQISGLPNASAILSAYDAAVAHYVAGEPVIPDPSLPQGIQMLLQGLTSPINLPFARELWTADAAAMLAQITVPVLIIIGKKDIQVDWHADGEPLQRAAAGHKDVTFVFPENANHVLKYEPKSRSELTAAEAAVRYNAPDAYLDPDVETCIIDWLKAHA